MKEAPYRSPSRARRTETEERIASSEEKLGPLARSLLPAKLRERLAQLHTDTDGREDEDVDGLREDLAAALEEALAHAKQRERELRALPFDHPDAPVLEDAWGPIGTEEAAEPLLQEFDRMVRELDEHANVVRTGPRLTARFTYRDAPMLWSVHLGSALETPNGALSGPVFCFASGSHWLAIRAPSKLPHVFVRRQKATDIIKKALHLGKEIELGERTFDDEFFVEGDEPFARELLTKNVRDALLDRARLTKFTFYAGAETASVAWNTNLIGGVITPALRPSAEVLVAVRAAFAELRLVRGT